jgi:hypothetical protein
MAKWLNAVLGGAYTADVYRDSVLVADLDAVGATLEIASGTITLGTPDDESHTWEVRINPTYLLSPRPMRLRAMSLDAPNGLVSAFAGSYTSAGVLQQAIPLAGAPTVTPDPAQLFNSTAVASLGFVEDVP